MQARPAILRFDIHVQVLRKKGSDDLGLRGNFAMVVQAGLKRSAALYVLRVYRSTELEQGNEMLDIAGGGAPP